MANGWVWSLQCKSRALDDVHNPVPRRLLSSSSSCRSMSVHSVKDSIKPGKPLKPKAKAPKSPRQIGSNRHPLHSKSEPGRQNRTAVDPLLPAVKELPEGHPSRNVVEIIFHTSWSPKAFLGRVERIFKVQNPAQTVARFEEYRETVKGRAGSDRPCGGDDWDDRARCLADGNEVMRFHCMGPAGAGGTGDCSAAVARAFPGGKGAAICTFDGSGAAHEKAGGGRGRRTMLVCRVVAGRVCKKLGPDSFAEGRVGFDSVSGANSELLVFDSRAVLPCFLIIYKL